MPIDRFIADFACILAKLIIEVDGGQHNIHVERDLERTAAIEAAGYLVMRFWNDEVLKNIEGVLERIVETLAARSGLNN
jgi:very-short-patch-repair endonuclease